MKGKGIKAGKGIAIGIALGTALGAAFDNVGIGLALGIAIGAALDSSGYQWNGKDNEEGPEQQGE